MRAARLKTVTMVPQLTTTLFSVTGATLDIKDKVAGSRAVIPVNTMDMPTMYCTTPNSQSYWCLNSYSV